MSKTATPQTLTIPPFPNQPPRLYPCLILFSFERITQYLFFYPNYEGVNRYTLASNSYTSYCSSNSDHTTHTKYTLPDYTITESGSHLDTNFAVNSRPTLTIQSCTNSEGRFNFDSCFPIGDYQKTNNLDNQQYPYYPS